MKLKDYIELSSANLWKTKLRTFLTTFGVIIGIGALVSMLAFGTGMQKNVTNAFNAMELFNYLMVFPEPFSPKINAEDLILDNEAIGSFTKLKGVEAAFPDIRFPAEIGFRDDKEFSFIQVLPAQFADTKLVQLRAGSVYEADDAGSMIISDSFLRRLDIKDFEGVLGQKVRLSTLVLNFSEFNPLDLVGLLGGEKLPLTMKDYELTIVGVSERMGMSGPNLLRSDIMISPAAADKMKKITMTNLWDLFQQSSRKGGYPLVNIKVSSPKYVDSVRSKVEDMGFRTFAIIDQLEEIRTGFFFMDMILAAIGMIALVVASLGIINTMIMSAWALDGG
jgi:putative ABC transport system permease protein